MKRGVTDQKQGTKVNGRYFFAGDVLNRDDGACGGQRGGSDAGVMSSSKTAFQWQQLLLRCHGFWSQWRVGPASCPLSSNSSWFATPPTMIDGTVVVRDSSADAGVD